MQETKITMTKRIWILRFHWIGWTQILRNSTYSAQSRALTVITIYIRTNLSMISAYYLSLIFTKFLFYLVIFVLYDLLKPPHTYLSTEKYVFSRYYRKTGSITLYPLIVFVKSFFFYPTSSLIRDTITRSKEEKKT